MAHAWNISMPASGDSVVCAVSLSNLTCFFLDFLLPCRILGRINSRVGIDGCGLTSETQAFGETPPAGDGVGVGCCLSPTSGNDPSADNRDLGDDVASLSRRFLITPAVRGDDVPIRLLMRWPPRLIIRLSRLHSSNFKASKHMLPLGQCTVMLCRIGCLCRLVTLLACRLSLNERHHQSAFAPLFLVIGHFWSGRLRKI